ncbi:unnamed protein product [Arabis nemorensis]|uniref:KIB1-4 beta-propeller domain-containing protein n=1 Tax=Arabis nemorensis TaxID=586526 RepID=A0A565C8Y0_9BRAS|nr:unnamed protein product [Arabis nemorensis]
MSKIVKWSSLPDELVDLIADRVFSDVEHLRLRSIRKSWRSAIATNKRFPKRFNLNRRRPLCSYSGHTCLLSPAAFFRVVLSSCPNKGWLIKTQDVSKLRKQLVSPLSRVFISSSEPTLNLFDYTVTEIHQSYDVQYSVDFNRMSLNFARVVLVDDLVFAVNRYKEIRWCNSGESSTSTNAWTRILDEEAEHFSDIIVHKGQIYALDIKSAIWWISLSKLNIYQFGPSIPMNEYDIIDCKEKRLVECCGDLCVVHRFCKRFRVKRVNIEKTIGFKVYKMDEEMVEWVEIKSLGDQAFVMATDSCFSVLASEYYGCLENSIYFTDEEEKDNVKVFKLCDGSITKMVKSSCESCFQMFSPPFA